MSSTPPPDIDISDWPPMLKPIILFNGFEGPFSCEIINEKPENFVCFPKTNNKKIFWEGTIQSNLLIIEGQKYPYLFWEYKKLKLQGLRPHFKFSGQQIADQIFKLLSKLGLNSIQATNFVTFWIPKWIKHPSWFVHVLAQQKIDKLFHLKISPEPDEIKRIYLVFGKDDGTEFQLQSLPNFQWKMKKKRTVIEWGSTEIDF